jgi:hypothetical protein
LIEDADIGRGVIQGTRRHGPVRPISWPARLEKEAHLVAQVPMFEAGQGPLPPGAVAGCFLEISFDTAVGSTTGNVVVNGRQFDKPG